MVARASSLPLVEQPIEVEAVGPAQAVRDGERLPVVGTGEQGITPAHGPSLVPTRARLGALFLIEEGTVGGEPHPACRFDDDVRSRSIYGLRFPEPGAHQPWLDRRRLGGRLAASEAQ